MGKGFCFSLDAALGFLSVVFLVSVFSFPKTPEFDSVVVLQKADDLLKVWVAEDEWQETELIKDFQMFFPLQGGELFIGGKKLVLRESSSKKRAVVARGFRLDWNGKMEEIRLKVFY